MTELQDATLSTAIDTDATPTASGGGVPSLTESVEPKQEATKSVREDVEAAFREAEEQADDKAKEADAKGKDDKADDKAADQPDAKEKAPDKAEEAPKADAKAETVSEDAKDGESKVEKANGHSEPPKNFLPDAREVWKNTPRAVRRDIEGMSKAHEAEVAQFKEVADRYEAVREFDELARSNGHDLKHSLSRVVEIEDALASNPIAGLNRILMEVGPRKADGQPISLFELAQAVVQMGQQGYQQAVSRQPPQQNGSQPSEVQQLQAEIAAMKAQMTVQPIIERFASRNARYYELQNDVALFLQSGKIPASLSPEDRLAAAYDMAVRVNPDSSVAKDRPSTEGSEPDRRADEDFSGSKSIKSSPGSVSEEFDDQAASGESIRESLQKAARGLRA